jgi:ribosomal small subunit protein bTHX
MGRGDKKSRKGKIAIGSYGVSRNRKKIKAHLKRVTSKPTALPIAIGTETSAPEKPKAKRTPKKKEAASE